MAKVIKDLGDEHDPIGNGYELYEGNGKADGRRSMILFKALLASMFLGLAAYTGFAVMNDGINLISPFLGDITSLGWPGQFNADFLTYLWLSALWIAWRHKFSAAGIAMALFASVAGILFFSLYLLVSLAKADGDVVRLLLGEQHSAD